MSFLLTGQTDAGKSTFAGHLLYKTGFFQQDDCPYKLPRDFEQDTRKCKFSEIIDEINGICEDGKSKTMRTSEIPFIYEGNEYIMYDTPGHQIHIRELVGSLFSANLNCICLVISSIDKEFKESLEKGTVKEDLLLGRSTGCSNLIILYNKIDIESVSDENKALLLNYVKKLRYKNIKEFLVSGWTGENIETFLSSNILISIKDDNVAREISLTTKKAQITFVDLKEKNILITAGFSAILHCQSGEIAIVIDKIVDPNTKQSVIMVKNADYYFIKFDKEITGTRFVLRKDEHTLGFGKFIL
jgi:translation elongation factor EF-1alpha